MSDFKVIVSDVWVDVLDGWVDVSDEWVDVLDVRVDLSNMWNDVSDVRHDKSDDLPIWINIINSGVAKYYFGINSQEQLYIDSKQSLCQMCG